MEAFVNGREQLGKALVPHCLCVLSLLGKAELCLLVCLFVCLFVRFLLLSCLVVRLFVRALVGAGGDEDVMG